MTQPFGIAQTGKRPALCPSRPRIPALDRQGLPRCWQPVVLQPLEPLAVEPGQAVHAAQAQALCILPGRLYGSHTTTQSG